MLMRVPLITEDVRTFVSTPLLGSGAVVLITLTFKMTEKLAVSISPSTSYDALRVGSDV